MILSYKGKWPKIHETAFVAPSADIIGDVEIGDHSTIWFQVVIRGDVYSIRIGDRTNVQDHSTLHVTRKKSPLIIGNEVTIGHRALLHGCTIKDRALIGMGAIILDDAVIGEEAMVGAGALVTKKTVIPPRCLAVGSPAKVVRELKEEEIAYLKKSAENHVADGVEYYGNIAGPSRAGLSARLNNPDLDLFPNEFDGRFDDGFDEGR